MKIYFKTLNLKIFTCFKYDNNPSKDAMNIQEGLFVKQDRSQGKPSFEYWIDTKYYQYDQIHSSYTDMYLKEAIVILRDDKIKKIINEDIF